MEALAGDALMASISTSDRSLSRDLLRAGTWKDIYICLCEFLKHDQCRQCESPKVDLRLPCMHAAVSTTFFPAGGPLEFHYRKHQRNYRSRFLKFNYLLAKVPVRCYG
jgi:hypothetical protein